MTRPFKIESANINCLNDIQLTQLLNELLQSEAYKFGIAQRSAQVALNIRVGDGGEDGRISWLGGPEQTDYIPNRLTMFQNKATEMRPSAYAHELMTTASVGQPSVLKHKVEEVLDQSGAYIVFTTQELNTQQKDERIAAIRNKLREQGKSYANTCEISIYDASQIANWVNQFIPTIVSVQHWVGTSIERGLKTFQLWSEHEELSRLPFASVTSRNNIVTTISEKIEQPKSCFRLMGLSGLGKTRTAFQVFDENDSLRSLVVYVDANLTPSINALVADWVSLGLKAIVIVDNCEYHLHESLVKEVRREKSQISLLTLDYNLDSISSSTSYFKLEPMKDEELLLLLSPIYKDRLLDLDRIAAFAQGFPQMAVLLAEARLSDDPRIGELTEDQLANKLLWRRNEYENPDRLKILQACSLFDVFGVEKEVENQLVYIAGLVGINIDQVYECVQEYSKRGLIDRRGRFGQVVPKPLAIRLAGQWWSNARETKQLELVDGIPEGMVEGFCHQIEKMDFHTNVKKLSEKLCGPQGPFGQAEVILSVRGSRLFRSFVNVNTDSTSQALYRTLDKLDQQQLFTIQNDTRRNLVWALERLCFHAKIFHESAWCLLLLASAENENWSNNATGMFAQLFRIQLSGTAAKPDARFALLRKAIDLNKLNVDMVVLEALDQAIEIRGGSRTIGAEYQGTKSPLKEWRPEIWQEIFDFWQEAFDFLLFLLDRGEVQKQKVLSEIGNSIRTFVARGRIKMLDSAIRHIVSVNGPYWPAALDSIKNTFEYDSKGMVQEVKDALNSWLELLSPDYADLPEKLKIVVINPPYEHRIAQNGHYIDLASENAKALATEVALNINELVPHLDMLLQGEQKQSYSFGFQLAHELNDLNQLIALSFERLLVIEQANPIFILGIYSGIFKYSGEDEWQKKIDKLLDDELLIYLYPEFIRTGKIQKPHLDVFIYLINRGALLPSSANALSYGNVINGISHDNIAEFCLSLSEFGSEGVLAALNVIFMYCFGNEENLNKLRQPLKKLVSITPFSKKKAGRVTDVFHWYDLAKKLLEERDDEFAIALTKQLILACKVGLDHGDIWHYMKPLLFDLMRDYGDVLWPIFGDAIVHAEGMERYWLQQLLEYENSFSKEMPSILSLLPVKSVISWCETYPHLGPSFVATSVNILERDESGQQPSALFIALLEKFGADDRVASALRANMATRGWSGSLVPYLESDKSALSILLTNKNENVQHWVKNQIAYIDKQIEQESVMDEERNIGPEVSEKF